ncbi:MAG: metallophosphoesterase [Lachnospiraceae bacterium]|nr:metallophosphoesterase [Lachnospiraceae bacterium]
MTKDDYVIICGDFGGVWDAGSESRNEKYWLDWFAERSYTLLFVDGNHENFDRLNAYPVKTWHGGKVHELRPNVMHLMRGQVFEIDGKKIFTFGGASSHDITGGILEPDDPDFRKMKKMLDKGYKPYRINHLTWWEQELANEEEMQEGRNNLRAHDYTVDYIVTHCCSTSTQAFLGGSLYKPDRETDYLEFIKNHTSYKKWFFGHYHDNRNIFEKEILIYEQMIRIS